MSVAQVYSQNPKLQPLLEKYKPAIDKLLGEGAWVLYNTEHKCAWDEKLETGHYELRVGERTTTKDRYNGRVWIQDKVQVPNVVAKFKLYPMINCCGICVSTESVVVEEWRGKGLGTLLNSLRIDIARFLGYGLLLCTDITSNKYQRRILLRNGWKDVHGFINPRTKNTVMISVVNL